MNKIILILAMTIAVTSCGGKDNKVNSGNAAVTTPPTSEAITPSQPNNTIRQVAANFEGNYDLIEMERGDNCGANITILQECGGYRVLSNNMGPEEFCNVNKTSDNGDRNPPNPDRNPPNPDRNPPNPDRNPPSQYDRKIVTLEGNLLKSVIKVNEQLSFTSSMVLRNNGILEKMANFKSSQIRCIYQKR